MKHKISISNHGFTLIELLVTMSVVVIVLTVAVPSFKETMRSNRFAVQANGLVSALNLGRSEAVKRATRVTVCKSANATSCAGTGVNWEDGWIVFVDPTNPGGVVNGGDQVLQVFDSLDGGNTLKYNNIANRVSFNTLGFMPGFNGTFTLCDPSGAAHAKGLILSTK